MDPNAALNQIRAIIAEHWEIQDCNQNRQLAAGHWDQDLDSAVREGQLYQQLVTVVDGLDEWLSTGGFLPTRWDIGRETTLAELVEQHTQYLITGREQVVLERDALANEVIKLEDECDELRFDHAKACRERDELRWDNEKLERDLRHLQWDYADFARTHAAFEREHDDQSSRLPDTETGAVRAHPGRSW